MARILIGTAGGAPANNFIMSIRESGDGDYLIGMSAVATDLMLADVDERYIVPYAQAAGWAERVTQVIRRSRPDLIHSQHDFEVRELSRRRDDFTALGPTLFLPAPETVECCVDKARSYAVWKHAGIPVPETLLVTDPDALKNAFERFGGNVWLRATEGGGGKGALPTDNYEFARLWIERFHGWGAFTAAEMLSSDSITWMSIWYQGELIVAQTRRRLRWNFADRTLSGVTGITGVGETCSSPVVDEIAVAAIHAVDTSPHGIFAVDMTYDQQGRPNPTEINIGRFFTTHYFFTKAGVNFPKIFCDLALYGRRPKLAKKVNPLPDGLVWIRGMDVPPRLTTVDELQDLEHA
jgi:hypothetical protein